MTSDVDSDISAGDGDDVGIKEDVAKTKSTQNAFTELMRPKPKTPKRPPSQFRQPASDLDDLRNPRNNLLPYTQKPSAFQPGAVITFNDDWVLVKDAYPKSSVHLLLMPRLPKFNTIHPYDALQDPTFLASAKLELSKAIDIVASELRRLHGPYSSSEKPRVEALESDDPPDELPPGRDWHAEVMAGVHTHPSMNHLHIHVLSKDRHSPLLKHRKHYNSFNTDFFVPLDAFPLSTEERERRWHMDWHLIDMQCWRCGRNFGNRFARLKEHLEEEFQAWRKE